MAHKALMGGTVYEKYGGADLVGGTVYKKDYGKSVVGGTAYEVGFDDGMRTITITCSHENEIAEPYVEINGVRYTAFGENVTLIVPIGTVIKCGVNRIGSTSWYYGYVYLNSVRINFDSRQGDILSHTVNGNATIELKTYGVGNGSVYINAENVEMVTVTVNNISSDSAELGMSNDGNVNSGTYNVPIGIELTAWVGRYGSGEAKVVLNGTTVYSTSTYGTYYHTVTRNTAVIVNTVNDDGVITITEE